jgi:hypothetical protein
LDFTEPTSNFADFGLFASAGGPLDEPSSACSAFRLAAAAFLACALALWALARSLFRSRLYSVYFSIRASGTWKEKRANQDYKKRLVSRINPNLLLKIIL